MLGGPTVQTFRAPRHQRGPAYRYDGCRGKPAGALCPERGGRTPWPYFSFCGCRWGSRCGVYTLDHSWGEPSKGSACRFLECPESLRGTLTASIISDELSKLRVDMVGLSETRRPGSGETTSKGFTYYWSGKSNGHHVKGVAIGVSSKLQPSVVEVTPFDELIMRLRLKHFMSVVAVYAPIEVCETEEKEMFYPNLDSVLHQCPRRDALIFLGDFNAVTGTERAGYEICFGPPGD